MGYGYPRNHGCRISSDWIYKGMQAIIIENEVLRVTVLPGRGSDIVEFRYKPQDLDFLYFSPGGIRNPSKDIPAAYTDSPYLDYFSGGWNDILPNGGPPVQYQGAMLGQHAETPLLPWEYQIVEDSPIKVSVRLWVRTLRMPFRVEKTLSMKPGIPALFIDEQVTNESGQPLHLMWGQHIAFGCPFLTEGARIDAPARQFLVHDQIPEFEPRRFKPGSATQWPQAVDPEGKLADPRFVPRFGDLQAQEMAYLTNLEAGWYAITNPILKVGFAICFDPQLFKYIWYWQQMGNTASGFPWWGRTHTAALEPWTSYPTNGLIEAIENGTAINLLPGATIKTSLTAFAYEGLTQVRKITPTEEFIEIS
jgi:galactose mutarotase-like enzyme